MQRQIEVAIPENDVEPSSRETYTGPVCAPTGAHQAAAQSYRNDQLANLSPVRVIDKLYSIAILACKKNDKTLAIKAITELIVGLNFEYEEIATGLFRLYQYSKDCIRQDNMSEAIHVLEELRSTWAEAFHLSA